MNLLLITTLEAVYIIYMLNFFKTRYSFAHPINAFNHSYLKHPVGVSETPISTICQLGNHGAYIIAGLLFLRYYLIMNKTVSLSTIKLYSRMSVVLIGIVSLLNFNAVIYLMPFFITEYYLNKMFNIIK